MATKKKDTEEVAVVATPKYKGWQLLKMLKYNTRVARVVIKPEKSYTFEEVDKAIFNYMRKKG